MQARKHMEKMETFCHASNASQDTSVKKRQPQFQKCVLPDHSVQKGQWSQKTASQVTTAQEQVVQ